jgi:pimeloyl-ACP methyl ester carboxylesterase
MWLFDPLLRPADTSDMVAFARAEDAFDLRARLGDISAPTLVIAGKRDPIYPADIVAATAAGVQCGRLVSYPRTGHGGTLTHPRFAADVASFLLAD